MVFSGVCFNPMITVQEFTFSQMSYRIISFLSKDAQHDPSYINIYTFVCVWSQMDTCRVQVFMTQQHLVARSVLHIIASTNFWRLYVSCNLKKVRHIARFDLYCRYKQYNSQYFQYLFESVLCTRIC